MTVAISRPQLLASGFLPRILQRSIGTRPLAARPPPQPQTAYALNINKVPSPSTFSPISGPNIDVQPGAYIRSWCQEYDISFPDHMRPLRAKPPKNPFKLAVFFSRSHCIDVTSMKYFDRYEHPFARTMFDHYIAKKKIPLWYDAWGGVNALPFVISTAERKLKHAFRDALASRDYDRDGRRMATADGSVIMDLFGTLKIHTQEPKMVCNAKFAVLLEQMQFILGVAEVELRRGKDGRHLSPTHRPRDNARAGPAPYNRNQRGGVIAKPASARSDGVVTGGRTNNAIPARTGPGDRVNRPNSAYVKFV